MPEVPPAAYWLDGRRHLLDAWLERWRELVETAPPARLEALYTDPLHVQARRQIRRDAHFSRPVMRALAEAAEVAEARSGVALRGHRRRR